MSADEASSDEIVSAEVTLPGEPMADTLSYFTDELGFRIDSIFPADAPRVAVISGHGVRLRLDAKFVGDPGVIRLNRRGFTPHEVQTSAPNGTVVEFVADKEVLVLPALAPSLVVQCANDDSSFAAGRAGMEYRDLIPDRYGGRFIASHIRIRKGGPVADYVHHHHILFQMIFCVRGWVNVVYEEQGPPILLEAGDCFLQPPHIRHRVLESSDNMEVVEIACPAEHETCVDHEMKLTAKTVNTNRDFSGQRFVFHDASEAAWLPWVVDGFEYQDTGIEAATSGVASAIVVRSVGDGEDVSLDHDAEIRFIFVLAGLATLVGDGERHKLFKNSSCAIPAGIACKLTRVSTDFRMLEVFVPSR